MMKFKQLMFLSFSLLWFGISCGQDPSFFNLKKDKASDNHVGMDSNSIDNDNIQDADAQLNTVSQSQQEAAKVLGVNNGGVLSSINNIITNNSSANGSDNNLSNSDYIDVDNPDNFTIPGASDSEIIGVRRCLQKWGRVPFDYNIQNVRRIHAAINMGNYGYPINDTHITSYPELIIIYAGVNVNSNVVYRMLNPNGWYCMLVNVNVNSTLKIDLHCNARLADNKINVNVGSNVSDSVSTIGINVNSDVSINTIRTAGTECVR